MKISRKVARVLLVLLMIGCTVGIVSAEKLWIKEEAKSPNDIFNLQEIKKLEEGTHVRC